MILEIESTPTERLKELFHTPDEKSAIRSVCRQILYSLNLNKAPTPLKPICQKFNLKVNYNKAVKVEDSVLKIAPKGFEIDISSTKNWRRNRFTIAHELSHLILFNALGSPINSFDKSQHDEIELLCDIGASEILINEDELNSSLKEFKLETEGIKFLYDKFMVSYDALFLKLSEFLNANVLIWKKHSRNLNEKNELRVYRHFPKYKLAKKDTWLPSGCTVKHIRPNVFENLSEPNQTILEESFNILINNTTTKSYCIAFSFPHSRTSSSNLPMFEEFKVSDEATYDNCFMMLVFTDKSSYERTVSNFVRK